jgi:hypothetical protein
MEDIIERILGYSNEDMAAYCQRLINVITATKKKKIKVGRNVEEIEVPKYEKDKNIVERTIRSYEYYKNKKDDFSSLL